MHDKVAGRLAVTRKEKIAAQIEEQLALGGNSLLESDAYLMEVNMEDLAESTRVQHEYWLLAIKAAQVASQLRQEVHGQDGVDYG